MKKSFSSLHMLDYPHNDRVPVEYMIVEVLFGELFRLPVPEYLDICYGSILIELCRKQPGLMPRVSFAAWNFKTFFSFLRVE